jgi:hypothetical protein
MTPGINGSVTTSCQSVKSWNAFYEHAKYAAQLAAEPDHQQKQQQQQWFRTATW